MARSRERLNLVGGVVCFGLTALAVVFALLYGANLSPIGKAAVVIFLPVLPVLTMFFESSATASGQISGVKFSMRGMVAAYFLVLAAIWKFMPEPETKVVRVLIRDQGVQIQEPFTVLISVPKRNLIKLAGDTGEASAELDSALDTIPSLTVECKGYVTVTRENEPIPQNGIIPIELKRAAAEPPSPPTAEPAANAMQQPATAEQAESTPTTEPSKVTLHYRNVSGEPLTLFLLDWTRHYRFAKEGREGASPWIEIPVEPRDEYTPYNKFRSGAGWFSICLRDESGQLHEMSLANLFESESTLLTLDKDGATFTANLDSGGEP
jgi:hypothetical protein